MAYWPPEARSEPHSLLQERVPEVLPWRFNPKDPFDRPWQSWAKSAILSGRVCHSKVLQPVADEANGQRDRPFDSHGETPEGPERSLTTCEEARRLRSRMLDSKVSALGLRHVVPDQFNYLADDPTHLTTKPYHTRLLFMGQIGRSNIVAQGYPGVNIYDILNQEDEFSLEESGFQYFKIPVDITHWTNETARHQCLPLMEEWLKDFFKAQPVYIFTDTMSQ